MPRRQKPPGYEKWTWAEITAGHRFSKTERRWRKIADATIGPAGPDGKRPTYSQNPAGYDAYIGIAVVFFLVAILILIAGIAGK